MSVDSVIQDIKSYSHPHRVPTFKLSPQRITTSDGSERISNKVRLVSVDFNSDYYNITPNNNTISWIRKVSLDSNEKVIEAFPENINVVNPYYPKQYPTEEYHLCTLHLTPGSYTSPAEIVSEMNKNLNESLKELFNFTTSQVRAYSDVKLNYDNFVFNPAGVLQLENSNMTNVNLTSSEPVSYIVDGELVYTEDGTTKYLSNALVKLTLINNATISAALITNPKFQGNRFTEYQSDSDWYIHTSDIAALNNTGSENMISSFSILKTDANIDVYTVPGKISESFDMNSPAVHITDTSSTITFNKAQLKTFPEYIGLMQEQNSIKSSFLPNRYDYTRKYNKDLRFDVSLKLAVKEDSNSSYAEITDGTFSAHSLNFQDTLDRKQSSIITYSGKILNESMFNNASIKYPTTRLYYNDNSKYSDKYPYYFITGAESNLSSNITVDNYASSSVFRVPISNGRYTYIQTASDMDYFINNDSSINYNIDSGDITEFSYKNESAEDISFNEPSIIGYNYETLTDAGYIETDITFTKEKNFTSSVNKTSSYTVPATTPVDSTVLFSMNTENLFIAHKSLFIQCDRNGLTIPPEGSILYSDDESTLKYYKFTINEQSNYVKTYVSIVPAENSAESIPSGVYTLDTSRNLYTNSVSATDFYNISLPEFTTALTLPQITVADDSGRFYITSFIISISNTTPSDAEGNIVPIYYYYNQSLVPLWDYKGTIEPLFKRYAKNETELNYFRCAITEGSSKYITPFTVSESSATSTSAAVQLDSIIRETASNLYTYTNTNAVFTPLSTEQFALDEIYNTSISNILYLPHGTHKRIGEISAQLYKNSALTTESIDTTYMFSDIIDTNVKMTFLNSACAHDVKAEDITRTISSYTPTSTYINPEQYIHNTYYIQNEHTGEYIPILTLALQDGSSTILSTISVDGSENVENTPLGYSSGPINIFARPQKYIKGDTVYTPTSIYDLQANYYEYDFNKIYFNSNLRFNRVDVYSDSVDGSYIHYDTSDGKSGNTAVEMNKSDRFRKYFPYVSAPIEITKQDLINTTSADTNRYIYIGDGSEYSYTQNESFVPVIDQTNRYYKHTDYISYSQDEMDKNSINRANTLFNDIYVRIYRKETGTVMNISSDFLTLSNTHEGLMYNNIPVEMRYVPTNTPIILNDSFMYLRKGERVFQDRTGTIIRLYNDTRESTNSPIEECVKLGNELQTDPSVTKVACTSIGGRIQATFYTNRAGTDISIGTAYVAASIEKYTVSNLTATSSIIGSRDVMTLADFNNTVFFTPLDNTFIFSTHVFLDITAENTYKYSYNGREVELLKINVETREISEVLNVKLSENDSATSVEVMIRYDLTGTTPEGIAFWNKHTALNSRINPSLTFVLRDAETKEFYHFNSSASVSTITLNIVKSFVNTTQLRYYVPIDGYTHPDTYLTHPVIYKYYDFGNNVYKKIDRTKHYAYTYTITSEPIEDNTIPEHHKIAVVDFIRPNVDESPLPTEFIEGSYSWGGMDTVVEGHVVDENDKPYAERYVNITYDHTDSNQNRSDALIPPFSYFRYKEITDDMYHNISATHDLNLTTITEDSVKHQTLESNVIPYVEGKSLSEILSGGLNPRESQNVDATITPETTFMLPQENTNLTVAPLQTYPVNMFASEVSENPVKDTITLIDAITEEAVPARSEDGFNYTNMLLVSKDQNRNFSDSTMVQMNNPLDRNVVPEVELYEISKYVPRTTEAEEYDKYSFDFHNTVPEIINQKKVLEHSSDYAVSAFDKYIPIATATVNVVDASHKLTSDVNFDHIGTSFIAPYMFEALSVYVVHMMKDQYPELDIAEIKELVECNYMKHSVYKPAKYTFENKFTLTSGKPFDVYGELSDKTVYYRKNGEYFPILNDTDYSEDIKYFTEYFRKIGSEYVKVNQFAALVHDTQLPAVSYDIAQMTLDSDMGINKDKSEYASYSYLNFAYWDISETPHNYQYYIKNEYGFRLYRKYNEEDEEYEDYDIKNGLPEYPGSPIYIKYMHSFVPIAYFYTNDMHLRFTTVEKEFKYTFSTEYFNNLDLPVSTDYICSQFGIDINACTPEDIKVVRGYYACNLIGAELLNTYSYENIPKFGVRGKYYIMNPYPASVETSPEVFSYYNSHLLPTHTVYPEISENALNSYIENASKITTDESYNTTLPYIGVFMGESETSTTMVPIVINGFDKLLTFENKDQSLLPPTRLLYNDNTGNCSINGDIALSYPLDYVFERYHATVVDEKTYDYSRVGYFIPNYYENNNSGTSHFVPNAEVCSIDTTQLKRTDRAGRSLPTSILLGDIPLHVSKYHDTLLSERAAAIGYYPFPDSDREDGLKEFPVVYEVGTRYYYPEDDSVDKYARKNYYKYTLRNDSDDSTVSEYAVIKKDSFIYNEYGDTDTEGISGHQYHTHGLKLHFEDWSRIKLYKLVVGNGGALTISYKTYLNGYLNKEHAYRFKHYLEVLVKDDIVEIIPDKPVQDDIPNTGANSYVFRLTANYAGAQNGVVLDSTSTDTYTWANTMVKLGEDYNGWFDAEDKIDENGDITITNGSSKVVLHTSGESLGITRYMSVFQKEPVTKIRTQGLTAAIPSEVYKSYVPVLIDTKANSTYDMFAEPIVLNEGMLNTAGNYINGTNNENVNSSAIAPVMFTLYKDAEGKIDAGLKARVVYEVSTEYEGEIYRGFCRFVSYYTSCGAYTNLDTFTTEDEYCILPNSVPNTAYDKSLVWYSGNEMFYVPFTNTLVEESAEDYLKHLYAMFDDSEDTLEGYYTLHQPEGVRPITDIIYNNHYVNKETLTFTIIPRVVNENSVFVLNEVAQNRPSDISAAWEFFRNDFNSYICNFPYFYALDPEDTSFSAAPKGYLSTFSLVPSEIDSEKKVLNKYCISPRYFEYDSNKYPNYFFDISIYPNDPMGDTLQKFTNPCTNSEDYHAYIPIAFDNAGMRLFKNENPETPLSTLTIGRKILHPKLHATIGLYYIFDSQNDTVTETPAYNYVDFGICASRYSHEVLMFKLSDYENLLQELQQPGAPKLVGGVSEYVPNCYDHGFIPANGIRINCTKIYPSQFFKPEKTLSMGHLGLNVAEQFTKSTNGYICGDLNSHPFYNNAEELFKQDYMRVLVAYSTLYPDNYTVSVGFLIKGKLLPNSFGVSFNRIRDYLYDTSVASYDEGPTFRAYMDEWENPNMDIVMFTTNDTNEDFRVQLEGPSEELQKAFNDGIFNDETTIYLRRIVGDDCYFVIRVGYLYHGFMESHRWLNHINLNEGEFIEHTSAFKDDQFLYVLTKPNEPGRYFPIGAVISDYSTDEIENTDNFEYIHTNSMQDRGYHYITKTSGQTYVIPTDTYERVYIDEEFAENNDFKSNYVKNGLQRIRAYNIPYENGNTSNEFVIDLSEVSIDPKIAQLGELPADILSEERDGEYVMEYLTNCLHLPADSGISVSDMLSKAIFNCNADTEQFEMYSDKPYVYHNSSYKGLNHISMRPSNWISETNTTGVFYTIAIPIELSVHNTALLPYSMDLSKYVSDSFTSNTIAGTIFCYPMSLADNNLHITTTRYDEPVSVGVDIEYPNHDFIIRRADKVYIPEGREDEVNICGDGHYEVVAKSTIPGPGISADDSIKVMYPDTTYTYAVYDKARILINHESDPLSWTYMYVSKDDPNLVECDRRGLTSPEFTYVNEYLPDGTFTTRLAVYLHRDSPFISACCKVESGKLNFEEMHEKYTNFRWSGDFSTNTLNNFFYYAAPLFASHEFVNFCCLNVDTTEIIPISEILYDDVHVPVILEDGFFEYQHDVPLYHGLTKLNLTLEQVKDLKIDYVHGENVLHNINNFTSDTGDAGIMECVNLFGMNKRALVYLKDINGRPIYGNTLLVIPVVNKVPVFSYEVESEFSTYGAFRTLLKPRKYPLKHILRYDVIDDVLRAQFSSLHDYSKPSSEVYPDLDIAPSLNVDYNYLIQSAVSKSGIPITGSTILSPEYVKSDKTFSDLFNTEIMHEPVYYTNAKIFTRTDLYGEKLVKIPFYMQPSLNSTYGFTIASKATPITMDKYHTDVHYSIYDAASESIIQTGFFEYYTDLAVPTSVSLNGTNIFRNITKMEPGVKPNMHSKKVYDGMVEISTECGITENYIDYIFRDEKLGSEQFSVDESDRYYLMVSPKHFYIPSTMTEVDVILEDGSKFTEKYYMSTDSKYHKECNCDICRYLNFKIHHNSTEDSCEDCEQFDYKAVRTENGLYNIYATLMENRIGETHNGHLVAENVRIVNANSITDYISLSDTFVFTTRDVRTVIKNSMNVVKFAVDTFETIKQRSVKTGLDYIDVRFIEDVATDESINGIAVQILREGNAILGDYAILYAPHTRINQSRTDAKGNMYTIKNFENTYVHSLFAPSAEFKNASGEKVHRTFKHYQEGNGYYYDTMRLYIDEENRCFRGIYTDSNDYAVPLYLKCPEFSASYEDFFGKLTILDYVPELGLYKIYHNSSEHQPYNCDMVFYGSFVLKDTDGTEFIESRGRIVSAGNRYAMCYGVALEHNNLEVDEVVTIGSTRVRAIRPALSIAIGEPFMLTDRNLSHDDFTAIEVYHNNGSFGSTLYDRTASACLNESMNTIGVYTSSSKHSIRGISTNDDVKHADSNRYYDRYTKTESGWKYEPVRIPDTVYSRVGNRNTYSNIYPVNADLKHAAFGYDSNAIPIGFANKNDIENSIYLQNITYKITSGTSLAHKFLLTSKQFTETVSDSYAKYKIIVPEAIGGDISKYIKYLTYHFRPLNNTSIFYNVYGKHDFYHRIADTLPSSMNTLITIEFENGTYLHPNINDSISYDAQTGSYIYNNTKSIKNFYRRNTTIDAAEMICVPYRSNFCKKQYSYEPVPENNASKDHYIMSSSIKNYVMVSVAETTKVNEYGASIKANWLDHYLIQLNKVHSIETGSLIRPDATSEEYLIIPISECEDYNDSVLGDSYIFYYTESFYKSINQNNYRENISYVKSSLGDLVKYYDRPTAFMYNSKEIRLEDAITHKQILPAFNSVNDYRLVPISENTWNITLYDNYYNGSTANSTASYTVQAYIDGTILLSSQIAEDYINLKLNVAPDYASVISNAYTFTETPSYIIDTNIYSGFYIKALRNIIENGITSENVKYANAFIHSDGYLYIYIPETLSKLPWKNFTQKYERNPDGNYLYVNTGKYAGRYVPFEPTDKNIFSGVTTYRIPLNASDQSKANYIYVNGDVSGTVDLTNSEHFFYYKLFTREDSEINDVVFTEISDRYIANVNIKGSSSATGSEYDVSVNMKIGSDMYFMNSLFNFDSIESVVIPVSNINFILNATSVKGKYIFRKDVLPTNVDINYTVGNEALTFTILDYITNTDSEEDCIRNDNIRRFLTNCDISDTTLTIPSTDGTSNTENRVITLFEHNIVPDNSENIIKVPNINNALITTDLTIDLGDEDVYDENASEQIQRMYGPKTNLTDTTVSVFDYTRTRKVQHAEPLTATIDGVKYSMNPVGTFTEQMQSNDRHITHAPNTLDYSDNTLKYVEYIDRNLVSTNYKHSTYNGSECIPGEGYKNDEVAEIVKTYEFVPDDHNELLEKIMSLQQLKSEPSNALIFDSNYLNGNQTVYDSAFNYIAFVDIPDVEIDMRAGSPQYNFVLTGDIISAMQDWGYNTKVVSEDLILDGTPYSFINDETLYIAANVIPIYVNGMSRIGLRIITETIELSLPSDIGAFKCEVKQNPSGTYNITIIAETPCSITKYTNTQKSYASATTTINTSEYIPGESFKVQSTVIQSDVNITRHIITAQYKIPGETVNIRYNYRLNPLIYDGDDIITSEKVCLYRTAYIMSTAALIHEMGTLDNTLSNELNSSNTNMCAVEIMMLTADGITNSSAKIGVKYVYDAEGNASNIVIACESEAMTIANTLRKTVIVRLHAIRKHRTDSSVSGYPEGTFNETGGTALVRTVIPLEERYYDAECTIKHINGSYYYNAEDGRKIDIFRDDSPMIEYTKDGAIMKQTPDPNNRYNIGYVKDNVYGNTTEYNGEYISLDSANIFIRGVDINNVRNIYTPAETFLPGQTDKSKIFYKNLISNSTLDRNYDKRYIQVLNPSAGINAETDISKFMYVLIPTNLVTSSEDYEIYMTNLNLPNGDFVNKKYLLPAEKAVDFSLYAQIEAVDSDIFINREANAEGYAEIMENIRTELNTNSEIFDRSTTLDTIDAHDIHDYSCGFDKTTLGYSSESNVVATGSYFRTENPTYYYVKYDSNMNSNNIINYVQPFIDEFCLIPISGFKVSENTVGVKYTPAVNDYGVSIPSKLNIVDINGNIMENTNINYVEENGVKTFSAEHTNTGLKDPIYASLGNDCVELTIGEQVYQIPTAAVRYITSEDIHVNSVRYEQVYIPTEAVNLESDTISSIDGDTAINSVMYEVEDISTGETKVMLGMDFRNHNFVSLTEREIELINMGVLNGEQGWMCFFTLEDYMNANANLDKFGVDHSNCVSGGGTKNCKPIENITLIRFPSFRLVSKNIRVRKITEADGLVDISSITSGGRFSIITGERSFKRYATHYSQELALSSAPFVRISGEDAVNNDLEIINDSDEPVIDSALNTYSCIINDIYVKNILGFHASNGMYRHDYTVNKESGSYYRLEADIYIKTKDDYGDDVYHHAMPVIKSRALYDFVSALEEETTYDLKLMNNVLESDVITPYIYKIDELDLEFVLLTHDGKQFCRMDPEIVNNLQIALTKNNIITATGDMTYENYLYVKGTVAYKIAEASNTSVQVIIVPYAGYLESEKGSYTIVKSSEDTTEYVFNITMNNIYEVVLYGPNEKTYNIVNSFDEDKNLLKHAALEGISKVSYLPEQYIELKNLTFSIRLSKVVYTLPKHINTSFMFTANAEEITAEPVYLTYEKKNYTEGDTSKYISTFEFMGVKVSVVDGILRLHKFRSIKQNYEKDNTKMSNDELYTTVQSNPETGSDITLMKYYRKYDTPSVVSINSIKQTDSERVYVKNNEFTTESVPDRSVEIDIKEKYHLRNITTGYVSCNRTSTDDVNIYIYPNSEASVKDSNTITGCMNVLNSRMNNVGIGYVSYDNYNFTDYYVKSRVGIRNTEPEVFYETDTRNNEIIDALNTNKLYRTEKKNVYEYRSRTNGYKGIKRYYMQAGVRMYNPETGTVSYMQDSEQIGATGTGNVNKLFTYALYDVMVEDKIDVYTPSMEVNSVVRTDDFNMIGLNSSVKTIVNAVKHNPDIYPTEISNVYDESVIGEIITPTGVVSIVKEGDYYMCNNESVYLTRADGSDVPVRVEFEQGVLKYTLLKVGVNTYEVNIGGKQEVVHIRRAGGNPWINKGFRIACGDMPNVFKFNVYDHNAEEENVKNYEKLTFYYKGRAFTLVGSEEGESSKLPVIYTFQNAICGASGSISSALMKNTNGGSINVLLDDSNITEKSLTTVDVKDNKELLYDTYFNALVDSSIYNNDFITMLSTSAGNRIGLRFGFDCIPVRSGSVLYSERESFLDLNEQPNFDTDYGTIKLPNIVNYNKGKFELSKESYKLNDYNKNYRMIDDYYSNFTRDGDVSEKLGFNAFVIDINRNTTISADKSTDIDTAGESDTVGTPVYFIKGKYYSEQLYTGPVKCPREMNFVYKKQIQSGDKKNIKLVTYKLNEGDDVLSVIEDEKVLEEYIMKDTHYAENGVSLTVPTSIDVNITQNEDVEKCLNANPVRIGLNSIGSYDIIRTHEPVYGGLQQKINIDKTITLPSNMDAESNDMYVYLSARDVRYPLMPSVCNLRVEYM